MAENERKSDFTGNSGGKSEKKLRVLLRTFGCQMNVRDSEVVVGLLQKEGYALAKDELEADVIIFNTCSVRQHAEDRVFSLVGEYKKRREKGKIRSKKVPLVGVIGGSC